MRYHRALGALVVLLAIGATSCGDGQTDDPTGSSGDVVTVKMVDNAFEPSRIEVKAGDEVTFRFRNDGEVVHEAIVGDEAVQAEHEAEMQDRAAEEGAGEDEGHAETTGMDHGGPDGDAVSVEPGETGELTHTFEEAGGLLIGCHEPGHYDAGMRIAVTVT